MVERLFGDGTGGWWSGIVVWLGKRVWLVVRVVDGVAWWYVLGSGVGWLYGWVVSWYVLRSGYGWWYG